ncbi:MAG: MerR family transcriptional regulator [Pseudonocardiaceae bacterium]
MRERVATRDSVGVWTAGAVARRLQISTSTLRTWNHRYGVGPPQQRPGEHRRYSEADVAELTAMQRFIAAGIPPGAAADIVRRGPVASDESTPPALRAPRQAGRSPVRSARDIEHAAMRLDADALVQAFDTSLQTHGSLTTWTTLCRPVFMRIERQIHELGKCRDVEAILAWSLLASLHRIPQRTPTSHSTALLACMQGEHHALVLEVLHAALVERGIASCMLGSSAGDSAVLEAISRTRPALVVLSSHQPRTARLGPLRRITSRVTHVIAAGPGWNHSTAVPGNVRYLNDPHLVLDAIEQATVDLASRPG